MATKIYDTYDDAARDYLSLFRALRDAPSETSEQVTRGAGDVPVDALITRADEIADVSSSMVPLAMDCLKVPDMAVHEGISGQLLAQAAAELQVSVELVNIAASEATSPAAADTRMSREMTRAVRGARLRGAIDEMEKAMTVPPSAGLITAERRRRAGPEATTRDEAKQALKQAAETAVAAISGRVIETGGELAKSLIRAKWADVATAAGLTGTGVANLFDRLQEGTGRLVRRAITTAAKTLLNAWDKILALLGKDAEEEARAQVKAWLDTIQKEDKIELFRPLVNELYQVKALKTMLPSWLDKTKAEIDQINATSTDVTALSDKFTVLTGHINTVGSVAPLLALVAKVFPQVLLAVIAIQVALLAVLVYAGYDYIGYNQPKPLNLTKGVAEVIEENLFSV